MSTQIQLRGATTAEWTAANPIPKRAEVCINTDTLEIRIGNGSTRYLNLSPAATRLQYDSGAGTYSIVFGGANGIVVPGIDASTHKFSDTVITALVAQLKAAGLSAGAGAAGPANTLTIGTVTTLAATASATATITGTAPNQVLSLGLPVGAPGSGGGSGATPAISVGTITTLAATAQATATITGTAPNFVLNLGIPVGATGVTGPAPALAVGNVTKVAAGGTPTVGVRNTGAGAYAIDLGVVTGDPGSVGATPAIGVAVTQLAAGATPTVAVTGSAASPTITFGIPAGAPGSNGTNGTTPVVPVKFGAAVPTVGVTGTDRVYIARTLTSARMRVATAPAGSALTVQVQRSTDGSTWSNVGSALSIAAGATAEAVQTFTQAQAVGELLRLNITSVGSTTAATGVVVDVIWS